MKALKILCYVVTILGTLAGGVTFIDTILLAESAPQQAAGAAMAMTYAALPYVFARAVEKIGE